MYFSQGVQKPVCSAIPVGARLRRSGGHRPVNDDLEYPLKPAIFLKTIYLAVISDLVHDQRMQRIARSLSQNEYRVVLVGKRLGSSDPLSPEPYRQKRLYCFFSTGKLYYLEFNIKLFFFLLFKKTDAVCAADLDTIVPVYLVSKLKKARRVYDAHELFTEMKEVVSRPNIHRLWKWIEEKMVPRFKSGYTVSMSIAKEFESRYGVQYAVIRNCPYPGSSIPVPDHANRFILYQGAVNEGRGMEWLVPAMKYVNSTLHIYGNGNYLAQTKELIRQHDLAGKVYVHAPVTPGELQAITAKAYIGINLVENMGLNQYYSLANKFFDYMQSGIPQVTMQFPEYENINNAFEVALLVRELTEESISRAINRLLNDRTLYTRLQQNCLKAREAYNWQEEEKKLLSFYQNLFT